MDRPVCFWSTLTGIFRLNDTFSAAGIPESKLVEAHGSFAKATCRKCKANYDGKEILVSMFRCLFLSPEYMFTSQTWSVLLRPQALYFPLQHKANWYAYTTTYFVFIGRCDESKCS